MSTVRAAALALALAGCAPAPAPSLVADVLPPRPGPALDVSWVATDPEVAVAMLELAGVGPADLVYDLGCGDGPLVIAAARRHGARGVCVDLDPERIAEARRNAERAGVSERITFLVQDLFATDLAPATVVTLFLSPEVNRRLASKLRRELRPGARVVSHAYDLGDWVPERVIEVPVVPRRPVYLWRLPARDAIQGR